MKPLESRGTRSRRSRRASLRVAVGAIVMSTAKLASADADAGVRDAATAATPMGDGGTISGCVESIPPGAQRPKLAEVFPVTGLSGYASTLVVTIEHGKGENVLPRGLDLDGTGEAAKMLLAAGFALPHQDGGSGARLTVAALDKAHPERLTTKLELPVVALPKEPGRQVLTLPPLPVAVSRANGEIATTCTQPHRISVEDPIASVPDAKPKPNPEPRPQREEWTAMRRALTWGSLGLLAGAVIAYAVRRYMQRPKRVPPPPPPRPPWEVALERLDEVRHAGLLEQERHGEYFDRVSDAVRSYVGARFGFDALESTTDEILAHMTRAEYLQGVGVPELAAFLQECDLVKFANVLPTEHACASAINAGERIVRTTMPRDRAFDASTRPEGAHASRPPGARS